MSEVVDIETGQPQGSPPGRTGGGGGAGTGFAERLAGLETEVKHLATKRDVENVKVWVLCGVLGGMATAATIALTFMKVFGAQ